MIFDFQTILGTIALAIGLYASGLYIYSVVKRETRPHMFTWLIWSIIETINFLVQLSHGGGAGAWPMGLSALSCIVIFGLSFPFGTKDIQKIDYFWLSLSLIAIMAWAINENPFWAVILISLVNTGGIIPTMRKSWNDPNGESLTAYGIYALQFGVSIAAFSSFNFYTLTYPLNVMLGNIVLICICLLRRKAINNKLPV